MKRAIVAIAAVALAALFFTYTARFLLVVPGHDFVGDIAYADLLADSLREGRVFADWISSEAFGRPTTVQRSSALLFLPVAVLELLGVAPLAAAKLWLALLHAASIASFYAFARAYRVNRPAATLAALAYGVAPLHLISFVKTGHWQLAVSFFLAPLLCWRIVALAREPSSRAMAAFALLLAWALLADNERTVTLLPVVLALAAFELRRIRSGARARPIGAIAFAFALAALVSAAGTLPFLLESRWLALAQDPLLFSSRVIARFLHPFYVLDGGALLYAPDGARPVASAGVRGSFTLVLTAATAASWAIARRRAEPTALAQRGAEIGAVLLLVVWLGTSRPAWLVSSFALFPTSAGKSVLAGAVVMALAFVLGVLAWRRGTSSGARIATTTLFVALFLVPADAVLSRLPIASSIANAQWFLQVNLPLTTALLLGFAIDRAMREDVPPARFALAAGVVLALSSLDAVANSVSQEVLEQGMIERAEADDRAMSADLVPGRTLPVPYVESDARLSYAQRLTTRPSASSWLMWSAPRGAARRLSAIYAALESDDLAARVAAVEDAAQANVRYFVAPPHYRGLDALVAAGKLEPVSSSGNRVFRNAIHREDRLVTSAGSALDYERPAPERIVVPRATAGSLQIAESYYPYWRASRGARALVVREVRGMIEVDVPPDPDAAPVVLRFQRPPTDRWFVGMSALGLALSVGLGLRKPDRPTKSA